MPKFSFYLQGFKWCMNEGRFVKHDGLWCPECGRRLRQRPNGKQGKKTRETLINIENAQREITVKTSVIPERFYDNSHGLSTGIFTSSIGNCFQNPLENV
jgi:hypothetical protein